MNTITKVLLSLFLTFLCCPGCGGECDPVDPQSGLPVVINFNPGLPPFVFHKPIVGGNLHFGGSVSGGTTTGGVHPTASDGGLTEDAGLTHTTTETAL